MEAKVQPHPLEWVADAVFYQIFPERFCNGEPANDPPGVVPWNDLPTRENFFGGDLRGILARLDYLQDLGVTALYLNPIFRAGTNHRYDTWDYFQVDPALGDAALLKELVEAAHRRGMRLILDGVFNHCGEGFAPFQDVCEKGAASQFADWFLVHSFPLQKEPLSYATCGGAPYLPKLNASYRPVQEYLFKVARYWLEEAGIDGWRLDVPFKVPFAFWREFRRVVKAANPAAYLVGEVWREAAPWLEGDTFDGVTNYRLRELILDYCLTNVLDGEDFGFEVHMLRRAQGPLAANMLNLLGSHDTARIFTLLKGDLERLRIALTFLMTVPGAPLVYYGDEVGLLGEADPDCRRTMPWEEARWDTRVLSLYKELIALRRSHPAFRHGEVETLAAFNGIYAYRRSFGEDEAIVVLNPRESVPVFDLPTHSRQSAWADVASGEIVRSVAGVLRLPLVPARSARLLLPAC